MDVGGATDSGAWAIEARSKAWLLATMTFLGAIAVSPARAQAPMPMPVPAPIPSVLTWWDLPGEPGTQAGALIVDKAGNPGTPSPAGTVWELTVFGSRLIRLNPGTVLDAIAGTPATWTSWDLGPSVLAAGLAINAADVVFVRTTADLQRIDPSTNLTTRWADGGGFSQVSLDSGGSVYSALTPDQIERLTPSGAGDATATLWTVGNGFGSISGIAVNSTSGLVYYSNTSTNEIGELNPATNTVRRWSLPVGVTQPREVALNTVGDVWAVTGSNHIVRLNAPTNQVTVFTIPTPFSVPRGIASDAIGIVGFTESQANKIGFLLPIGAPVPVTPSSAPVFPNDPPILSATPTLQTPLTGTAEPTTVLDTAGATLIPPPSAEVSFPAISIALNLPFIEATTPNASEGPWGIDSDGVIPIGTFYFSSNISGSTNNRIVRITP